MSNPQTYDEWEASLPRGKTFTPRDAWDAAIEQSTKMREAVPAAVPDGAVQNALLTLRGIAGATARAWELPRREFIDEFLPWAQSRARDAVAKLEATSPSTPKQDAVPDGWVLQDARGTVGNAMLFWRKGGNGYTANLDEAQTYTREEAFAQHRIRETDRPWPLSYLLPRAGRSCDVQDVKPSEWVSAAQEGK